MVSISIHALLAESDAPEESGQRHSPGISIHALLAESDPIDVPQYQILDISIHALLAESDITLQYAHNFPTLFLSTLSLRRATTDDLGDRLANYCISIHALLAESDKASQIAYRLYNISIHALLAESDYMILSLKKIFKEHFYPRSPCGERLTMTITICIASKFLSTLSLRRATAKVHKTVGHFCAYGTNFMGIASSC